MKKYIKVFFCAIFSVCLMQPWIYNLVLTSAEGGIKNSLMPASVRPFPSCLLLGLVAGFNLSKTESIDQNLFTRRMDASDNSSAT